jgi:3-isopropylmalate dehydratase small subunit
VNNSILEKWKNNKTNIKINDKPKKCIIKEVDDIGILVEYTKYNTKEVVYYTLLSIDKIKPVIED